MARSEQDQAIQSMTEVTYDGGIYRQVNGLYFQENEDDEPQYGDPDKEDGQNGDDHALSPDENDKSTGMLTDDDDLPPSMVVGPLGGVLAMSSIKFNKKKSLSGTCSICNKRYRNLKQHLRTHSVRSREFKCTKCDKTFFTKVGMQLHMQTHALVKPYQCEECDKTFYTKNTLAVHKKTHEKGSFLCNVCGKNLKSSGTLNLHLRTHNGYRPYKCDVCDKTFAYDHVLRDHKLIHDGKKPHPCTICGRSFRQRSAMKNHVRFVHATKKKVSCEQCGRKFACENYLKSHIKRNHNGPKKLYGPCHICGRYLTAKSSLERHLDTHAKSKKCFVCKVKFWSEESFQTHIDLYKEVKPIRCGHCGILFHLKQEAEEHVVMHIMEDRQNNPQDGNLQPEVDTTQMEEGLITPFRCGHCGINFSSRKETERHLVWHIANNTIHLQNEEHQSKLCASKAQTTGEQGKCLKPFRCGHCGIYILSKTKAEKHVISHARGKLSSPQNQKPQHEGDELPNPQNDTDFIMQQANSETLGPDRDTDSVLQERDSRSQCPADQKIVFEITADGCDFSDSEDENCPESCPPSREILEFSSGHVAGISLLKDPSVHSFDVDEIKEQQLVMDDHFQLWKMPVSENSGYLKNTPACTSTQVVVVSIPEESTEPDDMVTESDDCLDPHGEEPEAGTEYQPTDARTEYQPTDARTEYEPNILLSQQELVLTPIPQMSDASAEQDNYDGNQDAHNIPADKDKNSGMDNTLYESDTHSSPPIHESKRKKRKAPLQLCETCGKETRNMKLHKRTHDKMYTSCDKCGKVLTKQSMYAHKRSHEKRRFSCSSCGRKFQTKTLLTLHMSVHNSERPFECGFCLKRFKRLCSLVVHKRSHTGEKPYACRMCNKKFGQASARNEHERLHTGERPYVCKVCGRGFKQHSALRSHEYTHTTEKKWKCEICGKRHKRSLDLKKHLKIHGNNREELICNICNRQFLAKSSLLRHKLLHNKFECSCCDRKFRTEEARNRHQEMYKDEKMLACGICGMTYHARYSLLRHMKSHTGATERKFRCDICTYPFRSERELYNHCLNYYGVKPFVCGHCGRKFHKHNQAKKHVLSHLETAEENADQQHHEPSNAEETGCDE